MRRFWVLGTALLLVAAACGGGDGGDLDEEGQAIADAIFDQLMADTEPGDPFGETEARCFADGVVAEFGSAELINLGLSVDEIEAGAEPSDVDLSEDQVGTMVDVMTDCVDFRALFTEEFRNEGISDESADCLADGFDDEFVRALAMSEFSTDGSDPTEDPEMAEKLFQLITDCLSFEELSNFGG